MLKITRVQSALLHKSPCGSSIKKWMSSTVVEEEVDKFRKMAQSWWDPNGSFKALHSMNLLRIPFIKGGFVNTGKINGDDSSPLKNLSIIDVGCGGGLLTEPLARLGANVIGIDAAEESIAIAEAHLQNNLKERVKYIPSTIEDFLANNPEMKFDAVVSSEVIEHVKDPSAFLKIAANLLNSNGSIFLTTINRTSLSWLGAIVIAENLLKIIPPGTHDWNKFITPEEITNILSANNCQTKLIHGMCYNPINNKWHWTESTPVNYALHAPNISSRSSKGFVSPNLLDSESFTNWVHKIEKYPLIPLIILIILGLYLLLLLVSYYFDRRDRRNHQGVTVCTDFKKEDITSVYYLVSVFTSPLFFSGTTSNVSMEIYGSAEKSKAYVLKDESLKVFSRAGIDTFLISSKIDLGKIERIRIWHDNTGSHPSWRCDKITIQDLERNEERIFYVRTLMCGLYGTLVLTIPAATMKDIKNWKRVFKEVFIEEIIESTSWISIMTPPPVSNFTRCQRLACVFLDLLAQCLANIMFHGIPLNDLTSSIDIGSYTYSYLKFFVRLKVTGFVLIVTLIFTFLFRNIRERFIPTLVIWKTHSELKDGRYVREEMLFNPNKNSEFPTIIRIPTTNENSPSRNIFDLPPTHLATAEGWIGKDTKGYAVRPEYNCPEPPEFVHAFPRPTEFHATQDSFKRAILIDSIRRANPEAFIFNDPSTRANDLISSEIYKYKNSNKLAPMTKKTIGELENFLHLNDAPMESFRVNEQVTSTGKPQHHKVYLEIFLMRPFEKRCLLPWWFRMIAWISVICFIFLFAYFSILYGIQMGALKSKSFFAQAFEMIIFTLLIVPPVRTLLLSLGIATFYKDYRKSDEERFQILFNNGGTDLEKLPKYKYVVFVPNTRHPPLSSYEAFIHKIKERRKEEKKKTFFVVSLYILLMTGLTLVAHYFDTKQSYYGIRNLQESFKLLPKHLKYSNAWGNIKSPEMFYEYMEKVFIPNVYPKTDYSGAEITRNKYNPTYLNDLHSLLVGLPRIRQIRNILKPNCEMAKGQCKVDYSKEDTKSYEPPDWILHGSNNPWIYQAFNHTQSLRVRGIEIEHGGGGYIANLGPNEKNANDQSLEILKRLKENSWIDNKTRAIFLEFQTSLPSINLYFIPTFLLERIQVGSFHTDSKIYPTFLAYPDSNIVLYMVLLSFLVISIVVFCLVLIYILNMKMHYKIYGISFLGFFWTWADICIILAATSVLGISITSSIIYADLLQRFYTLTNHEFLNLQVSAWWHETENYLIALTLCLSNLKIIRLLVFTNQRFYTTTVALQISFKFLSAFVFMMFIFLCAFAGSARIFFGSSLPEFQTFLRSFGTLVYELIFFDFYEDLNETHRIIGPVFFFVFGFLLSIISLNVFVALVVIGFQEAKQIAKERKNWFSPIGFLYGWIVKHFKHDRKRKATDKSDIPPMRLFKMREMTKTFLRECLSQQEMKRMLEMKNYMNNILKGSGYCLRSKSEKLKRIRESFQIKVDESILDEMRLKTISYIRNKKHLLFTEEDAQLYEDFKEKVKSMRKRKFEKKLKAVEAMLDHWI